MGSAHGANLHPINQRAGIGSGYTIPIDYGPVELYNTGTLPLFAGAFTLWEIVQVTYVGVGGSSANLSMDGSVTVGDAPSIDLTMMPDARVWGTCTLGASFLAVVAAVKAELSADLNARLKLRVHDYDVDVNGVCFTYQGGNRFWAGLICIPGTEICVLDDEKRITWPPFQAGSCSGAAQAALLAAPTASPPTVGAALASDGFGHNAVLWPGDRSALSAAFYDGATWSATHTIPTGLGPVAPALAFFRRTGPSPLGRTARCRRPPTNCRRQPTTTSSAPITSRPVSGTARLGPRRVRFDPPNDTGHR